MNAWFRILTLAILVAITACSHAAEREGRYAGSCDVIFEGSSTLDRFSGDVRKLPLRVNCATNDAGTAVLNTRLEMSPYELSTHNRKRDANMYKMFGADRFTNIVVAVTNAPLDFRQSGSAASAVSRANLPMMITMHGVTREVWASIVDSEGDEEGWDVGLETELSLRDFKLEPPTLLLGTIVVHDTVKLKAHVKLQKEPP